MRIYVPYTTLQPHTEMVLTGYDYELVRMVNDNSYNDYLQERWQERESFINCEHDVVFWCGAIESLERCIEPWCAFGIDNEHIFADGAPPTLNLMKFTRRFIQKHPGIWNDVIFKKQTEPSEINKPLWKVNDYWLSRLLAEKGIICHQHFPPVMNANPIKESVEIYI